MTESLEKRIQAGKSIIESQVDYFKANWGRVERKFKADQTHITPADIHLSDTILQKINQIFPEDQCFSEESSDVTKEVEVNSQYSWLLDPIDGTNNFALGFPMCAISLALLREGIPVYGFIYDFSRDSIIEGGPELGARDNGRTVQAYPNAFNKESIVSLHFPLKKEHIKKLDLILTNRIRSLGSGTLSLAYTALGITEGCIDYTLKIWDFAAAYAILLGAKGSFVFIGESAFPMKKFSVNQPKIAFYAGSASFCEYVKVSLES